MSATSDDGEKCKNSQRRDVLATTMQPFKVVRGEKTEKNLLRAPFAQFNIRFTVSLSNVNAIAPLLEQFSFFITFSTRSFVHGIKKKKII